MNRVPDPVLSSRIGFLLLRFCLGGHIKAGQYAPGAFPP